MQRAPQRNQGLFEALAGDGRPLLALAGIALIAFGAFALFLSANKQFLPHDVAYLGLTASDLCAHNQCKIVHFMFHDRVAFGGTLVAVGSLYLWLTAFPLSQGLRWAWWTLAASGATGFGSFLTYLGYGYLDTWHGTGTLFLLPIFVAGLWKAHREVPRQHRDSIGPHARPAGAGARLGRLLLLTNAACLIVGGLVIMTVGMTAVFVPQDLAFMGTTPDELRAISPRLIPLIAHDRAGFGGGVCCVGITMLLCTLFGQPSRALWQAMLIAGVAGYGTAIGIHPIVGYTSFVHLAPAYAGATIFLAGMALSYSGMNRDPKDQGVLRVTSRATSELAVTHGEPARS